MFQFQTGAIKRYLLDRPIVAVGATFQFQTGAIKSIEQTAKERSVAMFQFQTGAIKRDLDKEVVNLKCSFNSKLVRLKVTNLSNQSGSQTSVSIPNWCD